MSAFYWLTDPACLQYKQIAVLGVRRKRNERTSDPALLDASRYLESLAATNDLEVLTNEPDGRYEMPGSQPIVLTNTGIPLDEVEDPLLGSAAYRQASRILSASKVVCAADRSRSLRQPFCLLALFVLSS